MKIDVFSHVIPEKYRQVLYKAVPAGLPIQKIIDDFPTLYDMDHRFRIMDKFEDVRQVITVGIPPVEAIADSEKAVDLARVANDELAELILKHKDRFVAAAACLPMNHIDAALEETDRAINQLNFKGVQISTPINDRPLDLPEFMPLYERMDQYNLPIWLHPVRPADYADYRTERMSKHAIFAIFGWPYETTVAMTRLVLGGILEKYPSLKIITHHCGGMVPFYEQRIAASYDMYEMRIGEEAKQGLSREPIEYFKKFYYDTALFGSVPALMCAHSFCGGDNLLFGTDAPFDEEFGERATRQTIEAIKQMDIKDSEKKKVFEENVKRLLNLQL